MNDWRSIANFLALKRNTALLLVALVLAGTGEKLWLGFAPECRQTPGASILVQKPVAGLTGGQNTAQ